MCRNVACLQRDNLRRLLIRLYILSDQHKILERGVQIFRLYYQYLENMFSNEVTSEIFLQMWGRGHLILWIAGSWKARILGAKERGIKGI